MGAEQNVETPSQGPDNFEDRDRTHIRLAVDIALHLTLLGLMVFWCYKIFEPFLIPIVWGIVIAVAFRPVFQRVERLLGGRPKLAGALFILVVLSLAAVPTFMLADSLVDGTVKVANKLEDSTFSIPPPPEKVKEWPMVGERVYQAWSLASDNLQETLTRYAPQLQGLGKWLAQTVASFGMALLHSLLALIIATVLLIKFHSVGKTPRKIGRRLLGKRGGEMVEVAAATIRSVFQGVVLVALIQGFLAGVGLFAVGVPAAGLWTGLVIVLAVAQIPTLLVLGPTIIYVFSTHDSSTVAVVFTIWCLVVGLSDNILKPLFLGRGMQIPMLVILAGAIGGMIAFGILGLFLGAVILAMAYEVFTAWIAEAPAEESSAGEAPAE